MGFSPRAPTQGFTVLIVSDSSMPPSMVAMAKVELELAQSQLEAALRAWDTSVSELWRTSIALTQAQKRVTQAHELLRTAIDNAETGQRG